jgi:N-acetylglucosamine-6-sulfatase
VGTIVSNVDLAPTVVALSSAQARLQMDGRSLLQPLGTRAVLIETATYAAVRNNGSVYVEHDTGEKELYDLRAGNANYDPFQLESHHAANAYASIRTSLKNKLDKLRNCSGTACIVQ